MLPGLCAGPDTAVLPGHCAGPDTAVLPGHRAGPDTAVLPGHCAGPDTAVLPGHCAGPDTAVLPGHCAGPADLWTYTYVCIDPWLILVVIKDMRQNNCTHFAATSKIRPKGENDPTKRYLPSPIPRHCTDLALVTRTPSLAGFPALFLRPRTEEGCREPLAWNLGMGVTAMSRFAASPLPNSVFDVGNRCVPNHGPA